MVPEGCLIDLVLSNAAKLVLYAAGLWEILCARARARAPTTRLSFLSDFELFTALNVIERRLSRARDEQLQIR